MIKFLGLLLFFGLTGLILWAFNEALWRVEDEGGSDPDLLEHEADQENTQGYGQEIETNSTPRSAL